MRYVFLCGLPRGPQAGKILPCFFFSCEFEGMEGHKGPGLNLNVNSDVNSEISEFPVYPCGLIIRITG